MENSEFPVSSSITSIVDPTSKSQMMIDVRTYKGIYFSLRPKGDGYIAANRSSFDQGTGAHFTKDELIRKLSDFQEEL
jgi:hypothetical protein